MATMFRDVLFKEQLEKAPKKLSTTLKSVNNKPLPPTKIIEVIPCVIDSPKLLLN